MIRPSMAGIALRRIAQDLTCEAEASGGELTFGPNQSRALIDALEGAAQALDASDADWEGDHGACSA